MEHFCKNQSSIADSELVLNALLNCVKLWQICYQAYGEFTFSQLVANWGMYFLLSLSEMATIFNLSAAIKKFDAVVN